MMKNFIATLAVSILISCAFSAHAADAVDRVDQLVAESTGAVRMTISDLYRGDRYRDPFVVLQPGEVAVTSEQREFSFETFSIHALKLKGIMKEKKETYAILVDEELRMSFMLRKGKVLTFKNEAIPGVSGRINAAQKSVTLLTEEKDVQTLRLGEDEEEEGGKKDSGENPAGQE